MNLLLLSLYIFAGIIAFMLVFPFITVVLSLLKGAEKNTVSPEKATKNYDYANIITAYRNVEITKPLVKSLLLQTHKNHHVYLVADNCENVDWDIEDERLTVLVPSAPLNLKAKSIIYAVERFVRPHDYITVWDGDNLAHPFFLEEVNRWANKGFKAIQGQRTAKNLNTTLAATDSFGEFYKNYVERYVPPRLGSSAVISGSGMAVEAVLYKSYLYGKEIQEGQHKWKKMLQEDKILQNHILNADGRICWAKNAICFDEKVTNPEQVETQRSRWLFSYFQNIPNSTGLVLKGLVRFSWNQLYFGLITVSLPLFILIGSAGLAFLLGLAFDMRVAAAIAVSGLIFVGNIFWTIKLSDAPKAVWDALVGIPSFVYRQFRGLFKMFNPNKNFKHSEHTEVVNIEEIMELKAD